MDFIDNANLQEICDVKQPVLFEYETHCPDFFKRVNMDALLRYGELDMKVKDVTEYLQESVDSVDYFLLPMKTVNTLVVSDTHSKYISENNEVFLEDSGLIEQYQENNDYLKPAFTATTKYDVCVGSAGATTPMRYHTGYRNFLCVNSGKITVKMTPWKSRKYLYPVKDFSNYEFFSPVNVWKPQPKYSAEIEKMKLLEFDVVKGHILHIPPYWFYTIKYSDSNTVISNFSYNTIANLLANVQNYGQYYLQQSNTTTRVAKTFDIPEKLETPSADEKVEPPVNDAATALVSQLKESTIVANPSL